MKKTVNVNFEWDKLHEAIVGTVGNLTVPVWTDEYEFAPKEEQEFVRKFGGELMQKVAPSRYKLITEQMKTLVQTLEKFGVIVHQPRATNKDEEAYLANIRNCTQQLFARDHMLVIGNNIIETGMRDPAERKNKFPARELLYNILQERDYKFVSMPEPYPINAKSGFGSGPFLEGGDTLLCGKNIFVGVSGHASNELGIKWLQQYLGDEYIVHMIELTSGVLHLDCAMSLPREGLAIVCKQAFKHGLPSYFNEWDIIDVSLEKASYLACNGLVIDESNYICPSEHPDVAEQLTEYGVNVTMLEFDAVSQLGGAFRCAHHPLIRK
ncbi:hypothetical protein AADZ86_08545 [Colwelliaceae bacterium BS250]